MTIPRQLAPTVGPAHGGVEFLEGTLPGIGEVCKLPDEGKLVSKGSTSVLIKIRNCLLMKFIRSVSKMIKEDPKDFV